MFSLDSDSTSQVEADVDSISESTIKGERVIFKYLPAYLFEEKLKEHASSNEYSKYYNGLYNISKRYPWLEDIFKKLSRNITLVQRSYVEGDDFNKKRCYDLNYWLYNEVYKNLQSSEKDLIYFNEITTDLKRAWKKIVDDVFRNDHYKCYPDEKLLVNMGFLQEIKDLFDFYEDFNEMKKEIVDDTYNSCFKYVDYLKQRIPVYYAWRDSCKVDDFACKRYIDDYMKYRPAGIVSELSYISVILTYPGNPCYSSVYDVFIDAKVQPKRNDDIYRRKMEKLAKENPRGNLLLTDMGDGLRESEFFIPGDHDVYWYRKGWGIYNRITHNITLPMLGIAGVFLILYAFYKFTPLGKMFKHTRAKVRRRIQPNINYDDIVLLYGSEESLASSSVDSSYNLSYASSLS
ncbi:variable surface protein Vir14-related [Plasmodium vivax]|uniref:Variable surface protein Vir14-related n=1 Tax=Plasmodium vivax (strain Salvador I) TaxID=126793 RepID=A5KD57_PLAVS|nr:variable surface protein Vir14-related [Plasmodium vivax]EDL42712.1 variable surface protein Vir14-related [Plasmodium vivax]|eukprot:XP_001612505.1 variable surface protein Vir14-related [Plasmodium vivax Sal-1]